MLTWFTRCIHLLASLTGVRRTRQRSALLLSHTALTFDTAGQMVYDRQEPVSITPVDGASIVRQVVALMVTAGAIWPDGVDYRPGITYTSDRRRLDDGRLTHATVTLTGFTPRQERAIFKRVCGCIGGQPT